jgi:hypothetical protein
MSNMIKVKSYERKVRPSDKTLLEDGIILEDYPFDEDYESNVGVEYKIKYGGKIYYVKEYN